MKLRGLGARAQMAVMALVLGTGLFVIFNPKNENSNEIKNQLTKDPSIKSEENSSAQTPPKTLREVIAKNFEKQNEMVERVDFAGPMITNEHFYTEEEINNMTEIQFNELLKTTELKLPLRADIKKLPAAALHRTPEPILQAGKDLGLIKEVLKVHESYNDLAEGFYDRCAKAKERPTPVRALCLTNLIGIKKAKGENINDSAYPQELIDLTKIVTDL